MHLKLSEMEAKSLIGSKFGDGVLGRQWRFLSLECNRFVLITQTEFEKCVALVDIGVSVKMAMHIVKSGRDESDPVLVINFDVR